MNKVNPLYNRAAFKKDCTKIVSAFVKGNKKEANELLEHTALSLLKKKIQNAAKKSKLV